MNAQSKLPPYAITNKAHAYKHDGSKRTHEQFVLELNGLWGDVYTVAQGHTYTAWNVKIKFWDAINGEYFFRNANAILRGHGNRGDKRGQALAEQRTKEQKILVIK